MKPAVTAAGTMPRLDFRAGDPNLAALSEVLGRLVSTGDGKPLSDVEAHAYALMSAIATIADRTNSPVSAILIALANIIVLGCREIDGYLDAQASAAGADGEPVSLSTSTALTQFIGRLRDLNKQRRGRGMADRVARFLM